MAEEQHGGGPEGSHHKSIVAANADEGQGGDGQQTPQPGEEHLMKSETGLKRPAAGPLDPHPTPDHWLCGNRYN